MPSQTRFLFRYIVRMDDKVVKSIRDWKPLRKKAKEETRKRPLDNLLEDIKIMRRQTG